MANVRAILLVSLYVIWWPFSKLFKGIALLLAPIWTLASFILLPFIHLAHTLINIITFPFSVQWLERIEVMIDILDFRKVTDIASDAVHLPWHSRCHRVRDRCRHVRRLQARLLESQH
jgi:hypothetical protein